MLRPFALFLAVTTLAVPAAAQQAGGFQLPSGPRPTATANPRAQGPVDEESGPLIQRPRVISTATPTPTPTATPTATPAPVPTSAPSAAAARPIQRPAPQPSAAAPPRPGASAAPSAVPPPPGAADANPFPAVVAGATPAPAAPSAPAIAPAAPLPEPAVAEEGGAPGLPWAAILGGAAAVLALLAALGWWLRARAARPVVPAAIERPTLAPAAPAPAVLADAVQLTAQPLRLTRSFAFATLDYRLTLVNRAASALGALTVGADIVSAHAGAPVESQLAGPGTALEERHAIARLGPHQSVVLEGQVRLPLGEAQVIRQGRTPLLVPLLRVRVARGGEGVGEGENDALVRTFVVGRGAPGGGRVQPFNLDEGPRAYTEVAQRELA